MGGELVQLPDVFPFTLARQSRLSDIFGTFLPIISERVGDTTSLTSLAPFTHCLRGWVVRPLSFAVRAPKKSPRTENARGILCQCNEQTYPIQTDIQARAETSGRPIFTSPRPLHRPQRIMTLDLLEPGLPCGDSLALSIPRF